MQYRSKKELRLKIMLILSATFYSTFKAEWRKNEIGWHQMLRHGHLGGHLFPGLGFSSDVRTSGPGVHARMRAEQCHRFQQSGIILAISRLSCIKRPEGKPS